jgi:hypothetical protein
VARVVYAAAAVANLEAAFAFLHERAPESAAAVGDGLIGPRSSRPG